jgi:hypothetical protein
VGFEVSCLIIRLTLRVRLAADYDQLKGSIAQNKQEHRHARFFILFMCDCDALSATTKRA